MSGKVRYPLREAQWLSKTRRLPWVAFVEEALSPELCDAIVARIEAEAPALATINVPGGPVIDTRVRNNERVIFDDVALAADLFARTRAFLPAELAGGTLVGYNERFRGYRYRDGQRFAPHFDGAYWRPETERGREGSELTALFYVNEGFGGGETRLIDYEATIVPKRGSLLLFQHAMLHEGCPVTSGTKYVLRSDAMFWFERGHEP